MIAYASAHLKIRYLAAFTCAILNNQPIGFCSPAVLVKDTRRRGLRILPNDVLVITSFSWWRGRSQKQDGVVHVKATRLIPLSNSGLELRSHDFH
jgi:DNA polymerase III alpha subunit